MGGAIFSRRILMENKSWKSFKIEEIFVVVDGFYNKKPPMTGGNLPFLGATEKINGITGYTDAETVYIWNKTGNNSDQTFKNKIFGPNWIAITNNGSVGHAYFVPFKYTSSHDITSLYLPNREISTELGLFLVKILEIAGKQYSYARKWRPIRLRKTPIYLPVNNQGLPDWQFMEDYIKQEIKNQREHIISYYEKKLLNITLEKLDYNVEWKEFFFTDIFQEIKRGKRLTKSHQLEGDTPYVSSTGANNGVDNFISNSTNVRKYSNNLSLANSGSVGSCFYHYYEYIASDHVTALTSEYADEYIYKFMATIIARLEEKYSFNREISDTRISREKLFLPIDNNGNPHWKYMSNLIKKLEKDNMEKIIDYMHLYNY